MTAQTISRDSRGQVGPHGRVVMTAAAMERDESGWHRARAAGVTATDMRVLTGHGYTDETVYGRWDRKVHTDQYLADDADEPVDDPDADMLHMGLEVERGAAKIAARRLGLTVRKVGLVANSRNPILLADPDRQCSDGGGMELKRTGRWYLQRYDGAEGMPVSDRGTTLSPAWWTQVQHQMLVTGWPHVWVAAHERDVDRMHMWKVDRDQKACDTFEVLADMFWGHVLERSVPPLSWDSITAAEVQARYPQAQVEHITVADPVQARAKLAEFLTVKEARTELEKREKDLGNWLRAMAGDAAEVQDQDGTVLWTNANQSRAGLDTKRLTADHPELVAAYRSASQFRVLRPNRKAVDTATEQKETAA